MSKKIVFVPHEPFAAIADISPSPASTAIPKWFKNADKYLPYESEDGLEGYGTTTATTSTYKHCSPFLDSLTSGYVWKAPVDIEVRKVPDANDFLFRWRTPYTLMSEHTPEQHPGLPGSSQCMDGKVRKWEFPFSIETPKGYSTMFMHPLNRWDLPFRTLSGVVDTDNYPLAVRFPFQLLNFEGERIFIEEGTPLVQFLPFKRENWSSETEDYDYEKIERANHSFWKKITRSYKKQFWVKKQYA